MVAFAKPAIVAALITAGGVWIGVAPDAQDRAPLKALHTPADHHTKARTHAPARRTGGSCRLLHARSRRPRPITPSPRADVTLAQRGEVHAIDGPEGLAADASGEEVMGGDVGEGDDGRGVRDDVDVELSVGP